MAPALPLATWRGPKTVGRRADGERAATAQWTQRRFGSRTGTRRRQWPGGRAPASSTASGPHAAAGLHLLDPGAWRLGADLRGRLLRGLLGGPAGHFQALRR